MSVLLLFCLVTLLTAPCGATPRHFGGEASVVDCCHCEERYSGETHVTWYASPRTCENQALGNLHCQRVQVLGRSCETTRWVPGPDGLTCQSVHLQKVSADGQLSPLVTTALSP